MRVIVTTAALVAYGLTGCSKPTGSSGSNSSNAKAQILAALPTYTRYGWSGGAANASSNTATSFPITGTQVSGNAVTINYAWKNGVLNGTLSGTEISGTWTQTNGNGPMAVDFDANGNSCAAGGPMRATRQPTTRPFS
jgi:hypothetical protein